ncbi:MAG: MalY/PatB family protein [bacterium]
MTTGWRGRWGGVAWRVDERTEDPGRTLRLGHPDSSLEWLRFDCLDRDPHWHLDPDGRDEKHPLGESGDCAGEVFDKLRRELPSLLERAGADAETAHDAARGLDGDEGRRFLLEAERALRHRPAVLDELDPRVLFRRRSEKWHTYPPDVLPAWVAEMDFPVAAPIQAELRRFTEESDIGYPLAPERTGLAEVFAERMAERFGWSADPARVDILSEVVQGMYWALEAFAAPGEGAIVQTPIYPPFLHSVRETGRRLIENRLVPGGDRLELDLDGLDEGIDPETRVLMLCNPHNPSGRVFSRAELESLAERVLAHDLVVVSDEIHADLLFDEREHVPFAMLAPEIASRTVTLTSPSKAFNIPGLRCAVAHFGSAALQDRFQGILPRHLRGGIGLLGLHASMAAWRWGQPWLDEVVPYLQANRDFARARLAERLPEIRFFPPEGTYLAWMDCSGLEVEGSPAAHFLRAGRVALSDGRAFGPGWERHVRLNLATSRSILAEVIERMAKAMGR